jgi:hypothetical protein
MQHYLRVNYNLPNPFRPDMPGFSRFYWIVDDDQLKTPQDDAGLKRWRDEIVDYRWVPIEQMDRGINDETPVKFHDDAMDTLRMLAGRWMPPVAALTYDQRLLRSVAGNLHRTQPDPANLTGHYLGLHVAMGEARKRADEAKRGAGHWADEIMPGPRQEEEWLRQERDPLG